MGLPLIIAHRAMTPGAVENTRSALVIAANSGADLIELDIRLSLDRQPVVLHDAFLRRSTRGRGWVRMWPSFALRRVPLRETPDRERVATLASVLKAFPDRAQPALHLKDRAALPSVLRAIGRYGNPERTWLWLGHPRDVQIASRRFPGIRITLLRPAGWMPYNRERYFREAQWHGAAAVSVPWGAVDAELLRHAHGHNLRVFTRLERLEPVEHLADLGLDGVITDDPQAVRERLQDHPS